MPTVDPPTPTLTPLPTRGNADRFLDFSPINAGNAISVQNSLRQLLSIHFPAGEYSQYYYPVAPEAERLWKPVFRNDERSSIGNEDRTVDQIVALGCEEGVKRDFFWQISGQIEKLGIKRDGEYFALNFIYLFCLLWNIHKALLACLMKIQYCRIFESSMLTWNYPGTNRSGKLDVGYLIAQAMRRSSSGGSPSTISQLPDPRLLATLLVPQIEGFLASNISIRFLILHFPFNHLGTVFELRKLLGTDLFKISGVLDSLASNPPPMSRLRTPLSSNPLSNDAIAAQNNSRPDYLNKSRSRSDHLTTLRRQTSFAGGQPKTGATSFAKANFVLPSTATDAEITAFLSGIWKTLMEKSPFYTPVSPSFTDNYFPVCISCERFTP